MVIARDGVYSAFRCTMVSPIYLSFCQPTMEAVKNVAQKLTGEDKPAPTNAADVRHSFIFSSSLYIVRGEY